MRKCTILLLLLTIYISGIAQQRSIDSLQTIVNDPTIKDKDKIIAYSQLSGFTQGDFTTSMRYSRIAVSLSTKQKEKHYGVYAYSNLGLLYCLKGDAERSYSIIDSCLACIKESSDIRANAIGYNRIGVIKLQLEDKDGLTDIYRSLELLKNTEHSRDTQSSDYYILSSYHQSDIEKLDLYTKLSLEAAKKSQRPNILCLGWSIRGVRYLLDPKQKEDIALLDSAIFCFDKSIDLYKQKPGYIRDIAYLNVLANASNAYQLKNEIKPDKVNIDLIDQYVKEANIVKERNHDIEFLVNYYQLLYIAATVKNDYALAEQINLEAIAELSKQEKLFKAKFELSHQLASLYQERKEYKKSTEYLNNSLDFYQKYYNERNIKTGQQLHAKYGLEKKEQELKFKQTQNNLYMGIAVFLLLALIFLVLFFTYRIKYLKQKEFLLKREKHETVLLAELKETESKRLQQEAVISNMQLNYKNELLDNILKNSLIDKAKIEKILNKELNIDNNFENFRTELKEIHPDFYTKLQNKAKQKLTSLDLKYCVCIFMKMSSKEIADLLHVESKTVRMTKYRLKQKLDLGKEEDLNTFIESII
ncbi:MAG: hypothetical protein ACK5KL_01765 [Dysgonomonas sp.]|jgi:DNA-binding CsgD family transcriptional regulator|nr:hypothetical protein [Prevotella sp.]